MKVKICGITRAEDARVAAEAGAWAVGFIFFQKSPRYVAPETAARISLGLPLSMEKVGVFVNERPSEIERIARIAGLTSVQLHGDESPESCGALSLPVIKVFRDSGNPDLKAYVGYCTSFLLDSKAPPGVWGGSGIRSDLEFAKNFRALRDSRAPGVDFLLAGGIDPTNAASAIREARPDGLDVSSGVEDAPGIKNAAKIRALMAQVPVRARKS
jgi:phosphoribosylanthranilate isomerase